VISVVVCHKIGDFIRKCVASIKKSIGVKYEIIVVTDDGDLRIEGVTMIHDHSGPALKRNIGAHFANGEYLAFFDDDTEVEIDCLFQMKSALESKNVGMVYSKLLTMGTNNFDDAGSYLGSWGFLIERSNNVADIGQFDKYTPILAGKSASCMIRRDVFDQVEGFDVDFFMFGEETDLSWRIWLAGYKVLFAPYAVTYHAFNTPLKDVKKHYSEKTVHYHGCKNYITMLIKNLETHNLLRILPRHLLVWTLVALIFVLTGEFTKAKFTFQGIAYNFRYFPTVWRKRLHINAHIRAKKDKDIWKHIFSRTSFRYYVNRFMTYIRQGRSRK